MAPDKDQDILTSLSQVTLNVYLLHKSAKFVSMCLYQNIFGAFNLFIRKLKYPRKRSQDGKEYYLF